MAVDPNRALLVMQPYRYATVSNATIQAVHKTSQPIVIDTNLDATGGAALAASLANACSVYARTFTVDVEDVLFLEDFTTAPNRYVVNFAGHPAAGNSTVYTVTSATIDYFNNITTLKVRG